MTARKIRVLVVDDSAVIRQMLCDLISETPDMEVAGKAADGRKGIAACESLRPDVVTLDIQMPGMNGLETLDAILKQRPVPVIMVSALTQAGADVTLDALERGALDYVAKPEQGSDALRTLRGELMRKIRSAAGADVHRILRIRQQRKEERAQRPRRSEVPERVTSVPPGELVNQCLAIGISTGGPPALASLFETLRPPMPPIVVVQHMPPAFTKSLSWRLDSLSQLSIKEAVQGDMLRPNHVYLAPGGKHLQLRRQGKWAKLVIRDGEPVSGHKPSVDVMMKSAAEAFGAGCLGVIMTGMGRDGADGCGAIRSRGGFVLGQDEASSDVYGMNRVAQVEGHVNQQFELSRAAAVIASRVKQMALSPAVA
jgi:two-component system chemotaxis response regulator CheB